MFIASRPLILASSSPRRQEFLTQLGLHFTVNPADIDETPQAGELPEDFSRRMARTKAALIAGNHPQACVIAADTVVALGQTIFGKPRDREEALAILTALQGRTHEVITGFAVLCAESAIAAVAAVSSQVTFASFAGTILQAYVDTGEPMDKAGAYGIQGRGAFLVHSLHGSYSNVVGLPVTELVAVLLQHRLIEPNLRRRPR